MTLIDRLIAADRETKKRVCVVGCSMRDLYIHGDLLPSQDGCMKFVERRHVEIPGGAAGAARQLFHWGCNAELVSLLPYAVHSDESWNQFSYDYSLESRRMPTKTRYIDPSGRIVFRHDLDNGYGLDANGMRDAREQALKAVQSCPWDAVLISDYEKGFVDEVMIESVIAHCNAKGIPVVADAKRPPGAYQGAILKCNQEYEQKFVDILSDFPPFNSDKFGGFVVTRGANTPVMGTKTSTWAEWDRLPPVICKSHVGAGDAFSAHLVLALAHGFSLEEAATIAHSAGRVYVQHEHGRPPWPHEIERDHDPVGGKVVPAMLLPALRRSIPGRIVLANGVFRLPHAGHAWLLEQAKAQGDVLVVAMNSDASTGRLKPGKRTLTFTERSRILGSMTAVDWIVAYDEPDPCAVIMELKPDVLVKGHEYSGQQVPGCDLVPAAWFAPESPFPRHSSDL